MNDRIVEMLIFKISNIVYKIMVTNHWMLQGKSGMYQLVDMFAPPEMNLITNITDVSSIFFSLTNLSSLLSLSITFCVSLASLFFSFILSYYLSFSLSQSPPLPFSISVTLALSLSPCLSFFLCLPLSFSLTISLPLCLSFSSHPRSLSLLLKINSALWFMIPILCSNYF